jgi:hypothetical protein
MSRPLSSTSAHAVVGFVDRIAMLAPAQKNNQLLQIISTFAKITRDESYKVIMEKSLQECNCYNPDHPKNPRSFLCLTPVLRNLPKSWLNIPLESNPAIAF